MLRSFVLCGLSGFAGLVACGGDKKSAKDPNDDKPAYTDESTPKWEGATPQPKLEQQKEKPDQPQTTSTPSKGSSGGPVNEGSARRSDQYDREGTEVALRRAARQVKDNCGAAKNEDGKAVGPWGKFTVQVQLGHNGHSKGTSLPTDLAGKPAGNCIEKAFTNLTFPPWAGGDTQVDWEVELVEPGKAAKK